MTPTTQRAQKEEEEEEEEEEEKEGIVKLSFEPLVGILIGFGHSATETTQIERGREKRNRGEKSSLDGHGSFITPMIS